MALDHEELEQLTTAASNGSMSRIRSWQGLLRVVLDPFSRKVVGWAIDRRCEALVNDALSMVGGTGSF
jgi:hypothetical protein